MITNEMLKHFKNRTDQHIYLVQKYCRRIYDSDPAFFKWLIALSMQHDESKFKAPEIDAYMHIQWHYFMKDEGKEYNPPANIKDEMDKATFHHVTNNRHHPEFHSPTKINLINREDRDMPPKDLVDARTMTNVDIAEMCADWLSMAEEKETDVRNWANKNIGVRWNFSPQQTDLIYKIISIVQNDR